MRSVLRQFFLNNENYSFYSVEIDGFACSFGIISKTCSVYHLIMVLTKQLPHIARARLVHEYSLAIIQLHLSNHFY